MSAAAGVGRARRRAVLPLLAVLAGGCGERAPAPAPPADGAAAATVEPAPAAAWTVGLRGTGGITFGMPASDAASALGGDWTDTTGACAYLRPERGPAGLAFMVEQGRIVRVDVDSAGVPTAEGATVGMAEADIRRLYPGLREMPHKYDGGGRYLVASSGEAADSALRLVFETDGARVTRYRAGRLPQVEYVERCG